MFRTAVPHVEGPVTIAVLTVIAVAVLAVAAISAVVALRSLRARPGAALSAPRRLALEARLELTGAESDRALIRLRLQLAEAVARLDGSGSLADSASPDAGLLAHRLDTAAGDIAAVLDSLVGLVSVRPLGRASFGLLRDQVRRIEAMVDGLTDTAVRASVGFSDAELDAIAARVNDEIAYIEHRNHALRELTTGPISSPGGH